MLGAWAMFRESFLHVGGAMALNEGSHGEDPHGENAGLWYPPKSFYLEVRPSLVVRLALPLNDTCALTLPPLYFLRAPPARASSASTARARAVV